MSSFIMWKDGQVSPTKSADPIIPSLALVYDRDTNELKVADGHTPFSLLEAIGTGLGGFPIVDLGEITDDVSAIVDFGGIT